MDGIFDGTAESSQRMLLLLTRENASMPIPYCEVLLTSCIMDSNFDQLRDRKLVASRTEADIVDRTDSELQYSLHEAVCYDDVALVG